MIVMVMTLFFHTFTLSHSNVNIVDNGDVDDLEDGVSKAACPRPHQGQHIGEAKQGDDDNLSKMRYSFAICLFATEKCKKVS